MLCMWSHFCFITLESIYYYLETNIQPTFEKVINMINVRSTTYKENQIDRNRSGLWQENLIRNLTTKDIVVIDERNVRTVIPPEQRHEFRSSEVGVELTFGGQLGPRRYKDKNISRDTQMEFTSDFVPLYLLDASPYHHKAMNLLISTAVNDDSLMHPDSKVVYSQQIQCLSSMMTNTDDSANIKILVNDPEHRRSSVFICIGGKTITVKCTHVHDDQNQASYSVVGSTESGSGVLATGIIEDLFTAGSKVVEGCFPVCFGLTSDDAVNAFAEYTRSCEARVQHQVDARIANERDKFTGKLDKMKSHLDVQSKKHKLESSKYDNIIEEARQENSKIRSEVENERASKAEWEALYKALSASKEMDNKRMMAQDKAAEQRSKVESENIKRTNELLKFAQTTVKIVIPLLIIVAPFLIGRDSSK